MVSVSGSREIVGRSSEIIVLAEGKHVVPEDVERAYLEHRAIREIGVLLHDGRLAAVVVPDPRQVARERRAMEEVVRDAIAQQSRRLSTWQRVGDYAVTRVGRARFPEYASPVQSVRRTARPRRRLREDHRQRTSRLRAVRQTAGTGSLGSFAPWRTIWAGSREAGKRGVENETGAEDVFTAPRRPPAQRCVRPGRNRLTPTGLASRPVFGGAGIEGPSQRLARGQCLAVPTGVKSV
jgi:hypothetical protein